MASEIDYEIIPAGKEKAEDHLRTAYEILSVATRPDLDIPQVILTTILAKLHVDDALEALCPKKKPYRPCRLIHKPRTCNF
jgi:hypothetical protein